YRGWKILPQVCYDLRFPVFSRNSDDYDLAIYVANWPQVRSHPWRTLLQARAIENLAYCVGVNRIGSDGNGLVYSGDSLVADFKGELLHDARDRAQVARLELDRVSLAQFRAKFPAHLDADSFALGE
ncbi:MAG: nitrilase-related carbon-nitrogen hydrolase, partial [Pseudomonadales bacterium]